MIDVKPTAKTIDDFLPFMLIIACVGCARFIKSELIIFSIFLATLAVYAWRRYDCRLLVVMGIILLVACAFLLAGETGSFANQIAIWAYYFLVIGVIGLLIEYIREKPKTSRETTLGEKQQCYMESVSGRKVRQIFATI